MNLASELEVLADDYNDNITGEKFIDEIEDVMKTLAKKGFYYIHISYRYFDIVTRNKLMLKIEEFDNKGYLIEMNHLEESVIVGW